MGHWEFMTATESLDGKLTGKFSDGDRQFRLQILMSALVRATAWLDKTRREWNAEIAAARRDGQGALADEKAKELADRLGRS